MIQGPNSFQGSPVYNLYVSNIDFSEPILIENGLVQDFVWKSDSHELIYSLYDHPNENYELWKSSISGNGKIQFSNTLVSEEEVSCSSDGEYFVYSLDGNLWINRLFE